MNKPKLAIFKGYRDPERDMQTKVTDEQLKRKRIRDAAKRALAETEERRRERDAKEDKRPKEINGRAGPEPSRYGDWEKDGIASDF